MPARDRACDVDPALAPGEGRGNKWKVLAVYGKKTNSRDCHILEGRVNKPTH